MLNFHAMKLGRIDAVDGWRLTGKVEELDGSRLGAGCPESDEPLVVRPASDIGRIACDHFGYRIGHGPPRLVFCARMAIAPGRVNIVGRRVGHSKIMLTPLNGWQEGTGQHAGTECLLESKHYAASSYSYSPQHAESTVLY